MYKGKKILGLIPARGGSKGMPRKNILPLLGKPLIAWTIECALNSLLDGVIVSTDSEEIAAVSREFGAEVPFLRPAEFSTDSASIIEVALHAQNMMEDTSEKFDALMILQPTSPLRRPMDVNASTALFQEREADCVVSVTEDRHLWWANTLPPDGCMENFLSPEAQKTRQALPALYKLNGAIYLAKWDFLKKNHTFYGKKTFAYIMEKKWSVDIDDELDFLYAEAVISGLGPAQG